MQYVFLILMCGFAAFSAIRSGGRISKTFVKADFWDISARLFFRIAASVMYVLIAVGSRTGVRHQTYYLFVLIGLCVSLAADVFFSLSGFKDLTAPGFSLLTTASIVYIVAFFSYAAPSWYDAALFILLSALSGAAIYNKDRTFFKKIPVFLYTVVLCAAAAKAISLLFLPDNKFIYTLFAAVGVCLFAFSNFVLILGVRSNEKTRLSASFNTVMYYAGQALIALSVVV